MDGGEEAVRRSSFTGMSRTVDEKWRAGKAECQLAGSAVKNGGSVSRSYFSIKAKKKKIWYENFPSVTLETFSEMYLKVLNDAKITSPVFSKNEMYVCIHMDICVVMHMHYTISYYIMQYCVI